jgi:hypothetical protein
MRTHVLALLAALLLLTVGAGAAAADEPTQAVGQEAASQQSASSDANATQVAPSNRNIDVRIFSPGSSGDVTQTNAAGALSKAVNANQTDQSATQTQSGAGTQAVGQEAGNHQSADADANAEQVKPSNENISVRIKSPGDNGDVEQTNVAESDATAGNANETTQAVEQAQGGGGCHDKCGDGGGEQAVGQSAWNKQDAEADADAVQIKPSNSNISVRIGSEGHNGDVTQTNAALADAKAGNRNETTQSAEQDQGGDGCDKCGHGGGGVQAVGQEAASKQSADADAKAIQYKPSNDNTSVRIHSKGDDGDVTQQNIAGADANAFNKNTTDQSATQSDGGGDSKCGCHGTPVQAVGQFAYNDQSADADATAKQIAPSNSNTPIRISSPGGGGDVTQTNAALADSFAGNLNSTTQTADQSQAGGGGVQAIGQEAKSHQSADSDATAVQWKPSNSNAPVSIGDGHGKKDDHDGCGCDNSHSAPAPAPRGGDVTQTNATLSESGAFNKNSTDQSVTQKQGGRDDAKCGCKHGGGVQAVGQSAHNKQHADSDANAFQLWASNHNSAGGGSVRQLNAVLARSLAANFNRTKQEVHQTQS